MTGTQLHKYASYVIIKGVKMHATLKQYMILAIFFKKTNNLSQFGYG